MAFQPQKLVSASDSASAAIANLASMTGQMEAKMNNNNCINYGSMLPGTNSLFNLHPSSAISMNQKPVSVVGFDSQQNVASMMPYLPMPIRADTSMIYPSFSPLAAAAAAYYNANCQQQQQQQQSSVNAGANSQSTNSAANLINAAFGVGTKFGSATVPSNHSPPAAQSQQMCQSLSLSQSQGGVKQSLQNDGAGAGMHVQEMNSLINSAGCNPFAPASANVASLPNTAVPMDTAWAAAAAAAATYNPYGTMSMSAYSMDLGNARRKNATRETTSTLKAWLHEHIKNPYPSKGEKIMLAIITKMTLTQVSTWFANARRRLKKENKMIWSPRNRCENDESGGATSSANQTTGSLDKFGYAQCDRATPTSDDDDLHSLSNAPERERERSQKTDAAPHFSRLPPNNQLALSNLNQPNGANQQQQQQPAFAKIWSLAQTASISDADANEKQGDRYLPAGGKSGNLTISANYEENGKNCSIAGLSGLSLLSAAKNGSFSAMNDAQYAASAANLNLGSLSKIVPEYQLGQPNDAFVNPNCAAKWQLEAAGSL